jgi:hypothetical protein
MFTKGIHLATDVNVKAKLNARLKGKGKGKAKAKAKAKLLKYEGYSLLSMLIGESWNVWGRV